MSALSRYEQTLLTQLVAEQEKRRRANDSGSQGSFYETVLPPPKEPVPSVYDADSLPLLGESPAYLTAFLGDQFAGAFRTSTAKVGVSDSKHD